MIRGGWRWRLFGEDPVESRMFAGNSEMRQGLH
jgi:hypothetical protein